MNSAPWTSTLHKVCLRIAICNAMQYFKSLSVLSAVTAPVQAAFSSWNSVNINGGGGFVDGIVFHPNTEGLVYARTDIGGLYRGNQDDSWTALTDGIIMDATW